MGTHSCTCPRKISSGMLKTILAQRYLSSRCGKIILQYCTVNHSRLPICLITTTSEQQMNKLHVQTPFPMAQLQWKHLPAQIIYPRMYSQIRSEKSRSIRKCAQGCVRARPPQLEGKDMLQIHYFEMSALLSQHSRDEKYTIGKIILQLDQGRWNTVEMKSSSPVLSNDIPAGYYFHTTEVQQFTYKHTRL